MVSKSKAKKPHSRKIASQRRRVTAIGLVGESSAQHETTQQLARSSSSQRDSNRDSPETGLLQSENVQEDTRSSAVPSTPSLASPGSTSIDNTDIDDAPTPTSGDVRARPRRTAPIPIPPRRHFPLVQGQHTNPMTYMFAGRNIKRADGRRFSRPGRDFYLKFGGIFPEPLSAPHFVQGWKEAPGVYNVAFGRGSADWVRSLPPRHMENEITNDGSNFMRNARLNRLRQSKMSENSSRGSSEDLESSTESESDESEESDQDRSEPDNDARSDKDSDEPPAKPPGGDEYADFDSGNPYTREDQVLGKRKWSLDNSGYGSPQYGGSSFQERMTSSGAKGQCRKDILARCGMTPITQVSEGRNVSSTDAFSNDVATGNKIPTSCKSKLCERDLSRTDPNCIQATPKEGHTDSDVNKAASNESINQLHQIETSEVLHESANLLSSNTFNNANPFHRGNIVGLSAKDTTRVVPSSRDSPIESRLNSKGQPADDSGVFDTQRKVTDGIEHVDCDYSAATKELASIWQDFSQQFVATLWKGNCRVDGNPVAGDTITTCFVNNASVCPVGPNSPGAKVQICTDPVHVAGSDLEGSGSTANTHGQPSSCNDENCSHSIYDLCRKNTIAERERQDKARQQIDRPEKERKRSSDRHQRAAQEKAAELAKNMKELRKDEEKEKENQAKAQRAAADSSDITKPQQQKAPEHSQREQQKWWESQLSKPGTGAAASAAQMASQESIPLSPLSSSQGNLDGTDDRSPQTL